MYGEFFVCHYVFAIWAIKKDFNDLGEIDKFVHKERNYNCI